VIFCVQQGNLDDCLRTKRLQLKRPLQPITTFAQPPDSGGPEIELIEVVLRVKSKHFERFEQRPTVLVKIDPDRTGTIPLAPTKNLKQSETRSTRSKCSTYHPGHCSSRDQSATLTILSATCLITLCNASRK
jgi:hypothetical protein